MLKLYLNIIYICYNNYVIQSKEIVLKVVFKMKIGNVDFETYLKKYPSRDGYFDKYGGIHVEGECTSKNNTHIKNKIRGLR